MIDPAKILRKTGVEALNELSSAEETRSEQLLRDIQLLYREEAIPAVVSMSQLAEALASMEDRPWAHQRIGKPITTNYLGKQLRRFGVKPRTVRIGEKTAKSYQREDFGDAFDRYPLEVSVTPVTRAETQVDSHEFGSVANGERDRLQTTRKPNDSVDVTDVTEQDEDFDYEYEERAAIIQFDGGHSREQAENLARSQLVGTRTDGGPN